MLLVFAHARQAAGLRTEFMSVDMLALAPDTVAVVEGPGSSRVRLFDAARGQQMGEAFTHGVEVVAVALSQVSSCDCVVFLERGSVQGIRGPHMGAPLSGSSVVWRVRLPAWCCTLPTHHMPYSHH
jgi:hypothetical protein